MLLLAVTAIPVAALAVETPIGLVRSAYVYTANGKGLNLRATPGANLDPIATIP